MEKFYFDAWSIVQLIPFQNIKRVLFKRWKFDPHIHIDQFYFFAEKHITKSSYMINHCITKLDTPAHTFELVVNIMTLQRDPTQYWKCHSNQTFRKHFGGSYAISQNAFTIIIILPADASVIYICDRRPPTVKLLPFELASRCSFMILWIANSTTVYNGIDLIMWEL